MRGALLVLVTVGCNSIFDLRDTKLVERDAPGIDARIDAPGCADAAFGTPTLVAGATPGYDPTLVSPLELWIARYDGNDLNLYVATRASDQDPFGAPIRASIDTPTQDQDPNFSADGLDVIWIHDQFANEAKRATTSDSFGPAVEVPALAGIMLGSTGLDLSSDGLTLYYVDTDGLHSMSRMRRDLPFGAPSAVLASGVGFPTISPDQLELYYTPPAAMMIHRMTRARSDAPFDAASDQTIFGGDDGDVAADARTMVLQRNTEIMISTRACP